MEELAGLAQYGYPGIVIAMIALVSAVIYKMFGVMQAYQVLMGDNFSRLNESFNENTKVLRETQASMKEVQETMRGCRHNAR